METFQPTKSECLRPTSQPEKNKRLRRQQSVFRYPGGKTRGASQIIAYIPEGITDLYSAFLGGGSIELELASRGINVHGYDMDIELVNCWQVLLTQPGRLSAILEKKHPLSKDGFYRLKQNFHGITDPIEKAAAFLVINRCSFNGGVFTSGFSSGKERFTKSTITRVAKFKAPNLHVHHADFKEALARHSNAFFYLDPPYVGKEKLYACSKSGFDHAGLASILTKRDKWLLSYADCSEVRELYKEHAIIPLKWAYGMPLNKESNELLIFSKDIRRKSTGSFSYYGGKSKIAKLYPEPLYNTIVEPFAGAAGYSILHRHKQVLLNEKDDIIHGIWNFLIKEANPELLLAKKDFYLGEDIRKHNLRPKPFEDLIGFCINRGCTQPAKTVQKWSCQSKKNPNWASTTASRITQMANLVPEIRHWKVVKGDYKNLPDIEATWFIDAPYVYGGAYYRHNKIDYKELELWCRSRKGQVIVCENTKATWLPFKPLIDIVGQKHKTTEAFYEQLNGIPTLSKIRQ